MKGDIFRLHLKNVALQDSYFLKNVLSEIDNCYELSIVQLKYYLIFFYETSSVMGSNLFLQGH